MGDAQELRQEEFCGTEKGEGVDCSALRKPAKRWGREKDASSVSAKNGKEDVFRNYKCGGRAKTVLRVLLQRGGKEKKTERVQEKGKVGFPLDGRRDHKKNVAYMPNV